MHYVRRFKETKFGYGLAYEHIFDDHKHSTYGVVFSYSPVDGLSFITSPGITTEAANPDVAFAVHIEATYEFELGENIHLGPAIEFAYDPEDIHLSLGLHLGFGF